MEENATKIKSNYCFFFFLSVSTEAPFQLFSFRPTNSNWTVSVTCGFFFSFASGTLGGCYLCVGIRAVSPRRSRKGAARSSAAAAAAAASLSQRSGLEVFGMSLANLSARYPPPAAPPVG